MTELTIIKQIEIPAKLDWNTLMPIAKNIMSLECQVECFYEAQMLQSALQEVDFERIKEACIWFINRYNEVNG